MTITAARKPTTRSAQAAAPLFHGQSTSNNAATNQDDFVSWFVAAAQEECPEMTDEQAARLASRACETWGGDRPYIAKRQGEGRSDRNAAIRRDFQRGESVAFLSRRYGLSRMQIYRLLGMEAPTNG